MNGVEIAGRPIQVREDKGPIVPAAAAAAY